jgi:hypothetical protein
VSAVQCQASAGALESTKRTQPVKPQNPSSLGVLQIVPCCRHRWPRPSVPRRRLHALECVESPLEQQWLVATGRGPVTVLVVRSSLFIAAAHAAQFRSNSKVRNAEILRPTADAVGNRTRDCQRRRPLISDCLRNFSCVEGAGKIASAKPLSCCVVRSRAAPHEKHMPVLSRLIVSLSSRQNVAPYGLSSLYVRNMSIRPQAKSHPG